MDSPIFPSIHLCDFCRTLSIEDKKTDHVITPGPWIKVVEGCEEFVQDTDLTKRPANLQYSVWEHYKKGHPDKHRTAFDSTVRSLKQASKAGCSLCIKLLRSFHDQGDDASLLVARFMAKRVTFGLALPIA